MEPGLDNPKRFEPLGELAVGALNAWLMQSRRNMRFGDWIIRGGSGGKVALVYLDHCDGPPKPRRLVLKLCPPGDDTEYEPANSRKAWLTAPEKFKPHLQEPFDACQVADTSRWLMFQRVAKGGMRGIGPLSSVPDSQIAAAYKAIVRPLLDEWARWQHDRSMRVSEFLTRQLGTRLGPTGRVRAWAQYRSELLEAPVPWIEISDGVLPNPFALVKRPSFGDIELQDAFVGKAHGDLHPDNILVPLTPLRGAQFVLVDLARYRGDAPLAQDPTQLVLCLVAQRYLSGTPAQREALIFLLAGPGGSAGTLVPKPAADLIRSFWLLSQLLSEQGLVDEWREQSCLSMVACALMFLGRGGIPDEDRWWFFRLAAQAAGTYLNLTDAARPTGSVPHVDPPHSGAAHSGSFLPGAPPETDATSEGRNEPHRDDARHAPALRLADTRPPEPVEERDADAVVLWVDFGRRQRIKAAQLTGLLAANATRLANEVTAIPPTLPPDAADSRATSARHLAAALVGLIDDLVALGIEDQFALDAAIRYTQALGEVNAALQTAQRLMSSLGTSASCAEDLGTLTTAAGQITNAVAELCGLVGPYP